MDEIKQSPVKDELKWFDAILPFIAFIAVQVIAGFMAMIAILILNWQQLLGSIKSGVISDKILNLALGKYSAIFSLSILASFIITSLMIVLYIKLRKINISQNGLRSFSSKYLIYVVFFNIFFFGTTFLYDTFLTATGFKPNTQINDYLNIFGKDLFGLVLLGITIVILAPIVEEVVFRGFLFGYLDKRYGFFVGALISSFIFASIHIYFIQFPMFLLIGFGLGYIAKRSGSIWPSVFAHFVNNGVLFVIMILTIGVIK